MNKNKTIFAVGCGAAALLAIGALAGRGDDANVSRSAEPATAPATPEGAAAAASGLAWRAGDRHRFELAYDTRSATALVADGPAISGGLHLDAVVAIEVTATYPDGAMRGRLVLDELRDGALDVGGNVVAAEQLRAALEGNGIAIALGACADVREVGVEQPAATDAATEGDARLAHEVLRTLWQDARFAVCSGDAQPRWRAVEASPHGHARVGYASAALDADAFRVTRTGIEMPFVRLAQGPAGSLAFANNGEAVVRGRRLDSVTSTESVRWPREGDARLTVETEVSLAHLTTETAELAPLARVEWTAPDARPVRRDIATQLQERRAEGLSADQLVERVAAHVGGDGPGYREFMWRAPARAALEPERVVPSLVELATAPGAAPDTVGLALDILAQGGTAATSAGLAAALADPGLQQHAYYPVFLQRASFVETPDASLLALIDGLVGAEDSDTKWAARYALGSVVSALDAEGDAAAAAPRHASLTGWLADAAGASERVHATRALANAARMSDLPAFVALADDADAGVRGAAASALSDRPSPQALRALLALSADSDDMVQRAALLALPNQPIAAGDLAALRDLVEAGRLNVRNERVAVETLTHLARVDQAGALEIAGMLEVMTADARTAAALADLRRWVESGAAGGE